jgi:GTP-binding protein EngB required for normal cell division
MSEAAPRMADVAGDAIRRYDDLKLEVAAIVQAAMLQCQKSKDAEGERSFQQLLARLAEDRFNLAVVGPFSRGKSSLMNAILGFDGLPTGILPHTSVITTVSYGPQERVLVRCDGWSLAEEIRLEQLAEYVTERGNPGNQRRVSLAEIELPAEILRHGLHFIDTPGLGSAIVANTETTERFLPEIDAAIFVSSFDFALSEADIEFLRRVRATVGVVFFVLNKLDLVSESEREEVVRFVRDRLDRELGVGRYALFAVSAKRGLEAKLDGNSTALAQSGLDELEAALAAFMAGDKTRQLAARVMDRLIALLQRELMHAGFAPATDRSPEQVSGVLDKFDEDLAMLNIRRAELVSSLETLGSDALRAIEPRINSAFANLKQSAVKKFRPDFSPARILSKPGAFEAFARKVSTFCGQSLARELRVYEAALNEHLERSASAVLAQISALPDELFMIAMNGDGSGREISPPCAEKSEAAPPDVAIAGMTHLKWSPRLPWWAYLAPARWFPTPMIKRFTVALDELLAQYRSNVDATIRCGMHEYLDRVSREIVTRIDANVARIKGALLSNGSGESRGVFEELLDRARHLRRQFDNEEDRRTQPENSGSNGSDVTAARSSAAVRSMRACPICGAVVQAIFDFLSKLQYELSMDGEAQHEHAETGGFCPVHTWLYANLTSPLGIARAYPAVLKARAAELRSLSRTARTIEELTSGLEESSGLHPVCKVCVIASDARDKAIAEMLSGRAANGSQDPASLCLLHLQPALRRCADLKSGRELVGECGRALDRVADDMRRYALKRDAIRRNLTTADEREAHQVGLSKLAGDRRLAFVQREDDRL